MTTSIKVGPSSVSFVNWSNWPRAASEPNHMRTLAFSHFVGLYQTRYPHITSGSMLWRAGDRPPGRRILGTETASRKGAFG